MKIVSWNVNSLRARLPHVQEWLQAHQPDVLGLQEIKMESAAFPLAELEALGYRAEVDGQRTYNGVALLSREPGRDIQRGIPGFEDEQRRVIAGTWGGTRIVNVYVPNGQSVGSDKYLYKLRWLDALSGWLREELARYPRLAIMGDFNIAPEDRDVHDPEAWRGKVLCSDAERAKLAVLVELGLADAFRLFEQPEGAYSWWDYRAAAFRRKHGLRIDLILVSAALAREVRASGIDVEPRGAERPSDHAPVWAEIAPG
jgi:exodeoxyribonuclease III